MSLFDDEKTKIIRALYDEAFRPGSRSSFTIDELDKVLPSEMIFGLTRAIIGSRCSDGYLTYTGGEYRISNDGIEYVEFMFDDLVSNDDGRSREAIPTAGVPAADRFVALDHNSDPYKEAVRSLDEAVEAFKEDRLLENEWGFEKGVLLRSLESGQQLLRETQVRIRTVISILIEPLRIVAERYRCLSGWVGYRRGGQSLATSRARSPLAPNPDGNGVMT